jgi:hypothetical protein
MGASSTSVSIFSRGIFADAWDLYLGESCNTNPRVDRKIMMKIVTRAMIDSLDQDGLGSESTTIYVPERQHFPLSIIEDRVYTINK